MKRRRVLQMGAALATLPLAGCGPAAPEPRALPPPPSGTSTGDEATAPVKPATSASAGEPATAASDPAPATSAKPAGNDGAAPGEAPKELSRVIAKVGK